MVDHRAHFGSRERMAARFQFRSRNPCAILSGLFQNSSRRHSKPSEEPLEQLEEEIQDLKRELAHEHHEDEPKFIDDGDEGPVDNSIAPPG